jgi:uncharacterized protein (TIGR00251 family)
MATDEGPGLDISRAITETEDGTVVSVWAVPGASDTGIAGIHGEALRIRVSAPADGGRANRALTRVLAEISGADVELVRGRRGRRKMFLLRGAAAAEVARRISEHSA